MHWRILRVNIVRWAWHCNFGYYVAFNSTIIIAMWIAIKTFWRELTNSYEPSKHYFKGRKD
jgi:hypothetical protein